MRLLPGSSHFHVTEEPAYTCSGSGEHLFLEIEKENLTSDLLAFAVAKAFGVKDVDVGWAGRKDRHAVTRQWFSIRTKDEGAVARIATLVPSDARVAVITVSRHGNKIRTGHLAGNRFRLGLAEVANPADLQQRLNSLQTNGISNRFGLQRFGINGASLKAAAAWSRGDAAEAIRWIVDPQGGWQVGQALPEGFRNGPEGQLIGALRKGLDPVAALRRCPEPLRKLLASAGQAAVFNAILDGRAQAGLLHTLRAGDLGIATVGAPFRVTAETAEEDTRRAAPGRLEVTASAPLPGMSRLVPEEPVLSEEKAWAAATGVDWAAFGERGVMESPGERRSVIMRFREAPTVTVEGDTTWVAFGLPSGGYATEVLTQAGVSLPEDRRG